MLLLLTFVLLVLFRARSNARLIYDIACRYPIKYIAELLEFGLLKRHSGRFC